MTTAIPLKTVASVISVSGEAFARNADGAVRRLAAGDVILEGEIVFTLANGQVELAFADGHAATILASESYLMGPETMVATSPDVYEAALAAAGEVGKVVTALEEGGDILEELEAPAAGAAAENSGNSFVRLLRISEGVTPVGYEFPVNPSEQIRAPEGDVIPEAEPVEPEEPENDYPSISSSSGAVDEEGLGGNAGDSYASGDLPGEATSFTGILDVNFGNDLPGTLVISGAGGVWDPTTMTLTGDGWALKYNGDGTYTFTLSKAQAHTFGDNTEGDLVFSFTATVTDSNGDSDTTEFSVTVDDDAPVAVDEPTQALSEGMNVVTDALSGTVDVGKDAGYVTINTMNDLQAGDAVTFTWSGAKTKDTVQWQLYDINSGTVVQSGTADSGKAGSLSLLVAADGDYELRVNYDAFNPGSADSISVTDVTVAHTVFDSITGNVLDNGDSYGADLVGSKVSAITYTDGDGTHTAAVSETGTTVYTLYGVLTIDQTGDYTYSANANVVDEGFEMDNFTYTIMDGDGDTDSASLNFKVEDVPDVVPSAAFFTMNTSNTGGGGDTGFQQFMISITADDDSTSLSQVVEVANEEGQQDFFVTMNGDVAFLPNHTYHVVLEYVSGSAHLNFTNFAISDMYGNVVELNSKGGSDNVTLTGSETSEYDGVIYNLTVDSLGDISVSDPVGYDINAVNGDSELVLASAAGQADFGLDLSDLPIENDGTGLDLFGEVDRINISGSGEQEDNTLTLSAADVMDLADGDYTLWVSGDTQDAVVLSDAGSWTMGADNVPGPDGVGLYTAYTALVDSTTVTLYVENELTQPSLPSTP